MTAYDSDYFSAAQRIINWMTELFMEEGSLQDITWINHRDYDSQTMAHNVGAVVLQQKDTGDESSEDHTEYTLRLSIQVLIPRREAGSDQEYIYFVEEKIERILKENRIPGNNIPIDEIDPISMEKRRSLFLESPEEEHFNIQYLKMEVEFSYSVQVIA
jgi:hypothetical protein